MQTTTWNVKGIHCASCKALIEDVCHDLAGVQMCEVDLENNRMTVTYEDQVSPNTIEQEVCSLGDYQLEQRV